ncbi:acyltransferase [Arsenophonus sp. ENCA]|uniref:acyltransferase family protein n=1 Tax=Arsenophonus sp. ENCA TaxID=1987579 RepID=UPI000BD133B4|nr:acyltransferase [Arsenophonus sp. ENCA]PAV10402.1 acyltransferase [Arsenophonus sp. ENCA]
MDKKLDSLQALRGVAALLVLLYHYRFYLRGNDVSGSSIWDALFGWGIIGVDIFFVISGFIMVYTTHHYQQGFISSRRFLINRAVRIIPIYYFGLLVAFLLGGAMSTFHYPEKIQNLISALTFTVYKTDVTPHYIDDGEMYNIRWTLNYEVYFYFVFTLCLLIKHRLIALLCWGALAMWIIPFWVGFLPTFSVQGYPVQNPFYGLLSNPIFLEFLIGAMVGYLHIWMKKRSMSTSLPLVSVVFSAIILIYIIWGVYTNNIRALNINSTLIVSAFILTLTLAEPILSKITPDALIYLGNISFSLYLLHNPVGIAVMKRVEPSTTAALNGVPYVVLAAVVSILAAHFSHKYIEMKLTAVIKQQLYTRFPSLKANINTPQVSRAN